MSDFADRYVLGEGNRPRNVHDTTYGDFVGVAIGEPSLMARVPYEMEYADDCPRYRLVLERAEEPNANTD